jgi:hypothetical protein
LVGECPALLIVGSSQQGLMAPQSFFIAHLVSSVIYHADRDKGKCDLRGGRRQGLVEWEGQKYAEIELNDATVASCRMML